MTSLPLTEVLQMMAGASIVPLSTLDYEAWAKREGWRAATEGLPLLLGVRPEDWPRFEASVGGAAPAAVVWTALATALGVPSDSDPELTPLQLRAAAVRIGLTPPPALERLLDFIQRLLPESVPEAAAAEAVVLAAQERETLLGAALMLVTRMPQDCVNDLGYFDSARITGLILQKALLWFPLDPPALDRAGIEALIARWLPPQGSD